MLVEENELGHREPNDQANVDIASEEPNSHPRWFWIVVVASLLIIFISCCCMCCCGYWYKRNKRAKTLQKIIVDVTDHSDSSSDTSSEESIGGPSTPSSIIYHHEYCYPQEMLQITPAPQFPALQTERANYAEYYEEEQQMESIIVPQNQNCDVTWHSAITYCGLEPSTRTAGVLATHASTDVQGSRITSSVMQHCTTHSNPVLVRYYSQDTSHVGDEPSGFAYIPEELSYPTQSGDNTQSIASSAKRSRYDYPNHLLAYEGSASKSRCSSSHEMCDNSTIHSSYAGSVQDPSSTRGASLARHSSLAAVHEPREVSVNYFDPDAVESLEETTSSVPTHPAHSSYCVTTEECALVAPTGLSSNMKSVRLALDEPEEGAFTSKSNEHWGDASIATMPPLARSNSSTTTRLSHYSSVPSMRSFKKKRRNKISRHSSMPLPSNLVDSGVTSVADVTDDFYYGRNSSFYV